MLQRLLDFVFRGSGHWHTIRVYSISFSFYLNRLHNWPNAIRTVFVVVLLHSHRIPSGMCTMYVHRMCLIDVLYTYHYMFPSPPVKRFACFAFLLVFFFVVRSGFIYVFVYTHLDGRRASCGCFVRNMFVPKLNGVKRKKQPPQKNMSWVCTRVLTRFKLSEQRSNLLWNVCLCNMVLQDYRGDRRFWFLQFSFIFHFFFSVFGLFFLSFLIRVVKCGSTSSIRWTLCFIFVFFFAKLE